MFYRNFQQKQNISLTENNQNRLSKLPDTISEASLKHNEPKIAIFFFFHWVCNSKKHRCRSRI